LFQKDDVRKKKEGGKGEPQGSSPNMNAKWKKHPGEAAAPKKKKRDGWQKGGKGKGPQVLSAPTKILREGNAKTELPIKRKGDLF